MKRFFRICCIVMIAVMLAGVVPTGITASAANYNWAGAWGSPALKGGITLGNNQFQDIIPANSTVRTVITPTIGGTKIRFKFSNHFGTGPITINEVTVAYTGETDDVIIADSVTAVTFNGGSASVTISAGSEVYSDEISFNTTALEKISVSSYFRKGTTLGTIGLYGGTTYLCSGLGNRTGKEDLTAFASRLDFTSGTITYRTIPFLTRADIYAEDAYSVVLLGDSTLTNEIYYNLAHKLNYNGIKNVGFVMSGIIGNELLNDGAGLLGTVYGESLLNRAQRDAFDVPGARYIIVKIGVNDVLHPMLISSEGKVPQVSASQVIQGYLELGKQAADESVQMYLCTRTPYKGYTRNFMGSDDLVWSQEGEDKLLEINSWVKHSATRFGFAGHINLDAIRSPEDSTKLYDHMTGDGVHFNEYGQIAVADLIPEVAYGVTRELTDLATILNINPYKAPVVQKPATTTQSSNNNNSSSGNQSASAPTTEKPTVSNPVVITPAQQQPTQAAPVITPETTTLVNANQIQVDTQTPGVIQGGTVTDSSDASRQMAGFAILSAVAVAIIAVAVVMMIKLSAGSSAPLTRGGAGRARQKKRV